MRKRLFATMMVAAALVLGMFAAGCGGGGGKSVSNTATSTSDSSTSNIAASFASGNFLGTGTEETTKFPEIFEAAQETTVGLGNDQSAITSASTGYGYLAAATYATYTVCAGCHSANYNSFVNTKHAKTWSENSSKFTKVCLNCHTLDNGFVDTDKDGVQDANETDTQFGKTPKGYAGTSSVAAEYQAVQCENCHGPASAHIAQGTPDKTTIVAGKDAGKAATCRFCHSQYEEWQESTHARAFYIQSTYPRSATGGCSTSDAAKMSPEPEELPACAALSAKTGSGGCGGCHTGDGFVKAVYFADNNPTLPNTDNQNFCSTGYAGVTTTPLKSSTNPDLSFCDKDKFGNFGITCAACHDPHGSKWPYQLRLSRDEICTKCHNDRYRKYNQTLTATDYQTVNGVLTTYTKNTVVTKYEKTPGSGRGPHAGGMTQVVSGENGAIRPAAGTLDTTYRYSYSTNNASATVNWEFIPSQPSMSASCVDCHMYSIESEGHETTTTGHSAVEYNGHTFKPRPAACQKCHVSMNVKSTVTTIQKEWTERFEDLETRYIKLLDKLGGKESARSKCSEGAASTSPSDGKSYYYCANAITLSSTATATDISNRDYAAILNYNLAILEIDTSKGVHNEPYSVQIYEVCDKILKDLGY